MHGRRTAHSAPGGEGRSAPLPPTPGADQSPEHQLTITLGLSDQLLSELVERLADLLAERCRETTASPWLSLPQAAAYLGFSRDKLYKLSAARAIPVRKKRDGQGLLFHRDELDQWVETAYQREGWLP